MKIRKISVVCHVYYKYCNLQQIGQSISEVVKNSVVKEVKPYAKWHWAPPSRLS